MTLGVLGVVTLGVLYVLIDIPDPNKDFTTQTTTVYYSDGKSKIGTFANQNRESVSLAHMSPHLQAAVIAAEDRTFWTNNGIDVKGMVRAFRNNAQAGQITAGGSTITQQYVKILYLNQNRTYTRKLKEAILSVKVSRQLTKQEILEGYLNTIYFGNGSYGVEVAAKTYFGKSAAELNPGQSAFLATVINNPSYFDPYAPEAEARILPRMSYVLDGMVDAGAITPTEYERYNHLPQFQKKQTNSRYGGTKGYLLDVVKKELLTSGFTEDEVVGGGFRITTTIDKTMQEKAVEAVNTVRPDHLKDIHAGLVSLDTETGALKALYGGPDFVKSQLNWATLKTQPGSTFKAFAVVAALLDGYDLQTRLDGNSPIRIGNDEIENTGDSGGHSYGRIDLEYATRKSVNTAFADLTDTMDEGPEKILRAANLLGIPRSTIKTIDPVLGVALGYAPVAPIDMATAYATIANDGDRHDWYSVAEVKRRDGTREFRHSSKGEQVIDEDVAADTIAALRGVVTGGTGTPGATMCPTLGKTGTATAGVGDNVHTSSVWFVGSTPKLTTAVMYNRGKGNEKLDGYLIPAIGGGYPARTFRTYMNSVLNSRSCGTCPPRANIDGDKDPGGYRTNWDRRRSTNSTPKKSTPKKSTPTKSVKTQKVQPPPSAPPQTQPPAPPVEPSAPPQTQPTAPTVEPTG